MVTSMWDQESELQAHAGTQGAAVAGKEHRLVGSRLIDDQR